MHSSVPVIHSLVQSVKGAGTNTLACAVAIVTLLILHDQGRALPRRERSRTYLVALGTQRMAGLPLVCEGLCYRFAPQPVCVLYGR